MSKAVYQLLRVLVIAGLVGGVLSACGGSSSKGANPSATTTTSSGDGATSTTKVAGPVTVAASDPTPAKAALQLSDVGAGFADYRKARGVLPFAAEACAVMAPGAFLSTKDHVYSGPMFKKKDATYFAYSEAYTFRTAADAKRFATFSATAAYKHCKQKQDDKATRDVRANTYVRLTPVAWSDPLGHIPTMYRELAGSTAGAKQNDNAFYDRYTVLRGRAVVVVAIDSGLGRDDAASAAIATQTGDILRVLDKALATRLAGV